MLDFKSLFKKKDLPKEEPKLIPYVSCRHIDNKGFCHCDCKITAFRASGHSFYVNIAIEGDPSCFTPEYRRLQELNGLVSVCDNKEDFWQYMKEIYGILRSSYLPYRFNCELETVCFIFGLREYREKRESLDPKAETWWFRDYCNEVSYINLDFDPLYTRFKFVPAKVICGKYMPIIQIA